MRWLASLLLLTSLTSGIAWAGFDIPAGVYTMLNIEDAKREALRRKVGITFLYSDHTDASGKVAGASLKIVQSLKDVTVVVYCNARKETGQLPNAVRVLVNGRQTGRYIPQTVITTTDLSRALVVVPYSEGRGFQIRLGNARRLMENEGKLIPDKAPPKVGGDTTSQRTWTNYKGTTVDASFAGRAGLDVKLKRLDGSIIRIPMNQLSQADQQWVRLNAAP